MRLIEIASLIDRIEDWNALPQERRRPLRAFDVMDVALRHASDSQETMTYRARRQLLRMAL